MTSSAASLTRRKSWLFFVRLGVAVVLMAVLILSTGVNAIVEVFRASQPSMVVAVGVGLMALVLLGAFNVWLVLNTLYRLSFLMFLRDYVYAWAASLVTPGQAGDASIVLFLKKHKIPMRISGVSYLVDKMMTLAIFALIAWYGCLHYIPQFKRLWLLLFALGFVGVPGFMFIIRALPVKAAWLQGFQGRIDESLKDLARLGSNWPILMANCGLTIVKWLMVSGVFYLAFYSINVTVRWPDFGVIPILATLVGYIPVSIAGIGTVEISATYLFALVDIGASAVVSVYLLLRSLQYLIAGGLMVVFTGSGPGLKKS